MSKQSDDNEPRRDRLIKYLMDELDPEEKFEIEKLCNLDPDWRAEKKLIQQSLSLLLDAGHDGFRLDRGPCEGLYFSQEEKNQILEELKKIKPQGKSDGKDSISKGKLYYWLPLAVAAAALVIAYLGTLERKNKEELMLAKVDTEKEQLKESDATYKTNSLINKKNGESKQDSFFSEDSQGLELAFGAKLSMTEKKRANVSEQAEQEKGIETLGDESVSSLLSATNPPSPLLKDKKLNHPPKVSPVDWSTIFKAPRAAFLHLENGDALGRVKVMGFSSGILEFKRADWPIQERSFALSSGTYQMRIIENTGKIYLLEGKVQKASSLPRSVSEPKQELVLYELLVNKAWRLAEDEKRLKVDF